MRAGEPIGQRQRYHHGKFWPPYPRPLGKPLPWIHRFHATHYWPFPYTGLDQADVNLVADLQVMNGWQCQTTFYDYHFDPLTDNLNSTGLSHLKWLLAHVPVQHRQAFLASSADPSVNDRRLASIQESVVQLVGNTQSLPVALRVTTPVGRPAHEIDAIFRQRIENMDSPVIPFSAAAAGGGSQ